LANEDSGDEGQLASESALQHVIIDEANFLTKSYAALHAFKTAFYGITFGSLCNHPLTLITDMTSQVPSKYSPAIEMQGDI